MGLTRIQTTVSLPDYMLADLGVEARREGISVSLLLERIAAERMYRPNGETLSSIDECRSGRDLEEVKLGSFEEFLESIDR